nr:MAG TPA: hypothetical protein [Crassvirales sp.]
MTIVVLFFFSFCLIAKSSKYLLTLYCYAIILPKDTATALLAVNLVLVTNSETSLVTSKTF